VFPKSARMVGKYRGKNIFTIPPGHCIMTRVVLPGLSTVYKFLWQNIYPDFYHRLYSH